MGREGMRQAGRNLLVEWGAGKVEATVKNKTKNTIPSGISIRARFLLGLHTSCGGGEAVVACGVRLRRMCCSLAANNSSLHVWNGWEGLVRARVPDKFEPQLTQNSADLSPQPTLLFSGRARRRDPAILSKAPCF